MNRLQVTHAVSAAVKYLAVATALAVYAPFIPGHVGAIALLAFGLVSATKDVLSALEKRLESPEDAVSVATDTLKDAQAVVEQAKQVVASVRSDAAVKKG